MKRDILSALTVIFIGLLFSMPTALLAAQNTTINLFYGDGCPHCARAKVFLSSETITSIPDVVVKEYEVYGDMQNAKILSEIGELLKVPSGGVPFFVVGNRAFVGFSETLTPKELLTQIEYCKQHGCEDVVQKLIESKNSHGKVVVPAVEEVKIEQMEKKHVDAGSFDAAPSVVAPVSLGQAEEVSTLPSVPFIGDFDIRSASLPIMAIIIGLIDGFNPCAMWVLLFLISLLIGMNDKKRMWILGSAFIGASAAVYFLFMVAWLNVMQFLSFVPFIKPAIGTVAVIGGMYMFTTHIRAKQSGCSISEGKKHKEVFLRIKNLVMEHRFPIAIFGIIMLAFAVNVVELVCSAGLPAMYTQVLSANNISSWERYAYIALYVLFFMIDDLIIFGIAIATLQVTGITTRYTHVSKMVGSLVLIVLGAILLVKPGLLMFAS